MDPQYDWKTPIEKTSVGLAKIILSNLVENIDLFIYPDGSKTPEEEAMVIEKATDFSINTLSLMSSTDIPADYASWPIDKVIIALNEVKRYIDGTVRQMNDEILSRTLGSKSPVTNTYAKDTATLGTLMLTLKKVREETGNNPDDYFIKKKELSTEPVVVEDKK